MAEPFPFATVQELRDRWPDFPAGGEAHATVLLEDASQFILDVAPSAANVSESTRRRVVCAVVRRAMEAAAGDMGGMSQVQATTGPYSTSYTPTNPHGDFYLTKTEKQSLGVGRQRAFSVQVGTTVTPIHAPTCSLNLGANYCSCGADIAGFPIYGGG
jgi:hypothetical protein